MAFCETKVRLLQTYNEAVDRYCALVQQRHEFDGLDEAGAAELMARIETVSREAKQHMRAANEHLSSHGCGAAIFPHRL